MGKWTKSESFEDSNPGTIESRAVCIVKQNSAVQYSVMQCNAVLYSAT